ncbi:hypothetical protein LOD99_8723 [Oopsacas minuta]|uniref:Major facilitator superfamily (MFS) profile domain-containing protein n=1 Tax=Oopsacas minuta TaxID=111878 RepID=A0AAV7JGK0_9METZ|nr:hypothetical protein LOD99_8723 [Oopsacas minuta]
MILPPEPIIFLYFSSLSFQRFILPEYIYYSSCRQLQGGNCSNILNQNQSVPCYNTSYSINSIQSYASYLSLVAQLLYTVPTLLTILLAGTLSDVRGRKLILITALAASILSSIIFLLIHLFNLHPYFILLPEIIDGIGGNHQSVTIAVSSMVADITSPKRRTFRLGIMESGILMGTCIFQVVSGYLLDWIGFMWSFVIIIIMYVTTLLYILFVPESLPKSANNSSPNGIYHTTKTILRQGITPLMLFIRNKDRFKFAIYLTVFGFIVGDVVTTLSIFPLYALAPPLCWGPSKQGWYLGLTYLARFIGIYLFLPFLFKCGCPDNLLILIGTLDSALVYGLTGVLNTDWGLLGVVPGVALLASLGVPSIRSSLSKLVLPSQHGSLFSIISLLNAVSSIISVVVFNSLYPTLRLINPSWIFYLVGGVTLLPALAVIVLMVYDIMAMKQKSIISETEGDQLINDTDTSIQEADSDNDQK